MKNTNKNDQTIKSKSADKEIKKFLEIKNEVSSISDKIIIELRQTIYLIQKIIKNRYKVHKLHHSTGLGDINLLYDEVIIYIQNSLNNDLFPFLLNHLSKIKNFFDELQTKIRGVRHFSKRKNLKPVDNNINNWKVTFLSLTDFIQDYHQIINQHVLKSGEAETGINKVDFLRKFRNLPLIKPVIEFVKNIFHTETLKIGNYNQLIEDVNNLLKELIKLYEIAIKEVYEFRENSFKNLNRIINNINKKVSDKIDKELAKENAKKWNKTYFPIFIDKWDKNNLQIFDAIHEKIKHSQDSLNNIIKETVSIVTLKEKIMKNLENFIYHVDKIINSLGKVWKKWLNKIDFKSCGERQFKLLSRIEKVNYKVNDFLLENLQYIYYVAIELQEKLENSEVDESQQEIKNFFIWVNDKYQEIKTEFYQRNSKVYDLIYDHHDEGFDSEFNQTINFQKMSQWIENIDSNEGFAICDFNVITNINIHTAELKSFWQETNRYNNKSSLPSSNSDLLNQGEIKYPIIISFIALLFFIIKCIKCFFYKNNKCFSKSHNLKNQNKFAIKNQKNGKKLSILDNNQELKQFISEDQKSNILENFNLNEKQQEIVHNISDDEYVEQFFLHE